MSRPQNSELYSHIPIANIVELHEKGLSHRKIGKLLNMGPCSVGSRLRAEGKTRPPARVSAADLRECRADPAWEARKRIADRVVCRECGEWKAELNANDNHSHLAGKEHMTAAEYKKKYPGARLVNFKRSADQNTRQGRSKTVEELMDEFAESYLTPADLKGYRRDPEWEEKHAIEDFVACRLCGFKSRVDLLAHLRTRHDGETTERYRQKFRKAPMVPLGVKKIKNEAQQPRSERLRKRAKIGLGITTSEAAGKVILYLVYHREASNPDTRAATNTNLSDRYMSKLRTLCGVPGEKGRPGARAQARTSAGSFDRQ